MVEGRRSVVEHKDLSVQDPKLDHLELVIRHSSEEGLDPRLRKDQRALDGGEAYPEGLQQGAGGSSTSFP
jgi:hypothetical protein